MTETTTAKPQPEIIVVPRARLAFARIYEAVPKKDKQGNPRTGKDGKVLKSYSCTLLLDPSNTEQQKAIALIKQTAFKALVAQFGPKEQWPKANPATGMGGVILCFGNGNDLPKVYDGYKDMFYVKLSDTSRPLIGNRRGEEVQDGDPQAPYAGCYVRARISPWVYFKSQKNPESANGVNFNFRSLQFVEDGPGFGGGGSRNADEEFEKMAGDAPSGGTGFDDDIPF